MSNQSDKHRALLNAKTRDELNVIAKQLNVSGFRRIARDSLIEVILQSNQTEKLSTLLTPSWWARYHNHVYGVSGILLAVLGILLAYRWQKSGQAELSSPSNSVAAIERNTKQVPTPQGSRSLNVEEARIASQSEAFSPVSMSEFFSRWNDKAATDLQRDQLEKELTGKTVIWIGRIDSIKPGTDSGVRVVVKPTDQPDQFAFAILEFDESQRTSFLRLRTGEIIRFAGVIGRLYLGTPFLDRCKLLSVG